MNSSISLYFEAGSKKSTCSTDILTITMKWDVINSMMRVDCVRYLFYVWDWVRNKEMIFSVEYFFVNIFQ
jgi:hypothetical protein